jgi:hypothetical protein
MLLSHNASLLHPLLEPCVMTVMNVVPADNSNALLPSLLRVRTELAICELSTLNTASMQHVQVK